MSKHSNTWIYAAVVGAALSAGAAHAETYGKLNLGGTFDGNYRIPGPDQKLDGGWNVGAGLGTNVSPNVRLEGELSYNGEDIKGGGRSRATMAMANAYYDFVPASQVTPFVGGGVGAVKVDPTGPAHDTAFGYNLQAGLASKFSDRVTGEVGYRYTSSNKLNLGGVDADYRDNAITAGVRYNFGG